ncbi:MAG: TetR/AcrR family transcriptional regulator [Thermodesulfobacteriota bacterium]
MATPLEKARQNPKSMKGKILAAARKLFGEYGFHGTTTRMIAKYVGIDISTLYYHWGEKTDLYEAVVLDINEGLRQKLMEVEKSIKGRPLTERLEYAIDEMTQYLFEYPQISNMTIFRYFTKTRHKTSLDARVPEFISDIAYSMGLASDKRRVTAEAKMKVLTIMNTMHNFVSGQSFFMPMLNLERDAYIRMVKETLKFSYVAAYARLETEGTNRNS